ncbi:XapX domain-containing protein [Dyella japonica]|uniref:XapX domain-containing protein n=1 Tax=Dyella japonica TaxID=231455 RepID=A0ABV2JWB9_9GAMM
MKIYVISLGVGLLVGLIYGVLDVRSPAPPMVALVGLVGILVGEQAIPIVKRMLRGQPVTVSVCSNELRAHTFAQLPSVNDLKSPRGEP